jgi:hypothetical protein
MVKIVSETKYLIMRHLSAILLLGFLVAMPSCKYFKGNQKSEDFAIMKAHADSLRVADSIQKILDRKMDEQLDSVRRAEDARLALEAKHKYNIIVGSFVTPEYANAMTEDYRKQGYDPEIIKIEGNKFELVSIEATDSYRTAATRLKQFQDTVQFESWLYIKK